jgi:hypothetical protein
MGGGGGQLGGFQGGATNWMNGGTPPQGGQGFQLPQGLGGANINQGQRNFIMNQGKLPTALGGGSVSQAQQNFLGGQSGGMPHQNSQNMFTGGTPMQGFNAPIQGNDYMSALMHMFGGGGGGWGTNYML